MLPTERFFAFDPSYCAATAPYRIVSNRIVSNRIESYVLDSPRHPRPYWF